MQRGKEKKKSLFIRISKHVFLLSIRDIAHNKFLIAIEILRDVTRLGDINFCFFPLDRNLWKGGGVSGCIWTLQRVTALSRFSFNIPLPLHLFSMPCHNIKYPVYFLPRMRTFPPSISMAEVLRRRRAYRTRDWRQEDHCKLFGFCGRRRRRKSTAIHYKPVGVKKRKSHDR